ncbi:MAG: branched-chain amino acid ABC transporter permease [Pseudomonadota bacterium]
MTELTPVQKDRLEDYRTRFTRPSFFLLIGLALGLAAAPLLFPSFRVMDVLAKVMVFTLLAASFDLILGFTGQLSLGHAMFFGIGAYSLSLTVYHSGSPHWVHLLLAPVLAVLLSVVLAVVISFFSLRVKAIFFAMMTLALAEFAYILSMQWYELTMAEDGVSFKLPGVLSVNWSGGTFLGAEVNGRLITYYVIWAAAILLFIGMIRFVRSPVGRVLESIRENEARSIALGFRTFRYQTFSIVFGSAMASLAGVLYALWMRYVNPDSVMSTPVMLNTLLMVIIGGLGTLYGGIIGAAFLQFAETWLPDLQKAAAAVLPGNELVQRLSERWILYFGILFVLVVFFFPKGFVGTARDINARRKLKRNMEEAPGDE